MKLSSPGEIIGGAEFQWLLGSSINRNKINKVVRRIGKKRSDGGGLSALLCLSDLLLF